MMTTISTQTKEWAKKKTKNGGLMTIRSQADQLVLLLKPRCMQATSFFSLVLLGLLLIKFVCYCSLKVNTTNLPQYFDNR